MNPLQILFARLRDRTSNVEDFLGYARLIGSYLHRAAGSLGDLLPRYIGFLFAKTARSPTALLTELPFTGQEASNWVAVSAELLSPGHILRRTDVMPDNQTQINVRWNLPHDWCKPTDKTIFPKPASSQVASRRPTHVGSARAQGTNQEQPEFDVNTLTLNRASPPQAARSASGQAVTAPIRSVEWIEEQIKGIEDEESRRLTSIAYLG